MIDGLQSIRGGEDGSVAEISEILRSLAHELEVPIVATSQVRPAVDLREDKRPYFEDWADPHSLFDCADSVVFIYRDDFYHKVYSECLASAEIVFRQQRNGATGSTRLIFLEDYARFDDWEPELYSSDEYPI